MLEEEPRDSVRDRDRLGERYTLTTRHGHAHKQTGAGAAYSLC